MKRSGCFLLGAILLAGVCSCNSERETIRFHDFDLFDLNAKELSYDDGRYADITYERKFPVNIRYVFAEREVELIFDDSFEIDKKKIYAYHTSNLLGGPPGRHRIYATHYEEYLQRVFVSRTDTILCTSNQLPADIYKQYNLYMVIRHKPDSIKCVVQSRDRRDDNFGNYQSMYKLWMDSLIRFNYPHREYKKGFPPSGSEH